MPPALIEVDKNYEHTWRDFLGQRAEGDELVFVTLTISDGHSPKLSKRFLARTAEVKTLTTLVSDLAADLGLNTAIQAAAKAAVEAKVLGTSVLVRREDGTYETLDPERYWIQEL